MPLIRKAFTSARSEAEWDKMHLQGVLMMGMDVLAFGYTKKHGVVCMTSITKVTSTSNSMSL